MATYIIIFLLGMIIIGPISYKLGKIDGFKEGKKYKNKLIQQDRTYGEFGNIYNSDSWFTRDETNNNDAGEYV